MFDYSESFQRINRVWLSRKINSLRIFCWLVYSKLYRSFVHGRSQCLVAWNLVGTPIGAHLMRRGRWWAVAYTDVDPAPAVSDCYIRWSIDTDMSVHWCFGDPIQHFQCASLEGCVLLTVLCCDSWHFGREEHVLRLHLQPSASTSGSLPSGVAGLQGIGMGCCKIESEREYMRQELWLWWNVWLCMYVCMCVRAYAFVYKRVCSCMRTTPS